MKTNSARITAVICGIALAWLNGIYAEEPTAPAKGKDAIVGAFGLKLGDVFNTNTASRTETKTYSVNNGPWVTETTCWLTPPEPHKAFTTVSIVITPATRKIAKIIGLAYNPAEDDLDEVRSVLRQKYVTKPIGSEGRQDMVIDQTNRYITVRGYSTASTGLVGGIYGGRDSSSYLEIVYWDQEIERLAAKEASQLKFQDKQGL